MSTISKQDVLRPAPRGLKGLLMPWVMETVVPFGLRVLRALPWNRRLGSVVIASRYDEVREVFLNSDAFRVPYKKNLDVIMQNKGPGHGFFLSMDDTDEYRRDTGAMRKVVRISDIPERLVPAVERLGESIVEEGRGRLEVVDQLVRRITFEVYQDYFGVPDPPGQDMRVLATRLFEFQFVDTGDPALRAEVEAIAPALHAHIQSLMDARRDSGVLGDDVLGRCLAMQADEERERPEHTAFDDDHIRRSLLGFIVGGPPQPPMVVPQALEQLLRRPDALLGAQQAARANDDKRLAGHVFEAMRFDPLAPFLQRVARRRTSIAAGTRRAVEVGDGDTVLVAFSSAMMDGRRIRDPRAFDPERLPHEYIHFGYGLHQCFGIHMNMALLPLMLKPLLRRENLRRAPGPDGRLRKRGAFADRLVVLYG
jgi:cytochrome P450